MTSSTLYEKDFYAWALAQADALRARRSGANDIDYNHLAEEVEDMGKAELHAARSYLRNILSYLLKLVYSVRRDPANHWRAEIVAWRQDLDDTLTPTLRARLPGQLAQIYEAAREIAALELSADNSEIEKLLPGTCPFTWEQMTARAPQWWPEEPP